MCAPVDRSNIEQLTSSVCKIMHANLIPRACPFAGAKARVEYTIKPAHSQQIAGFNTEAELYISYLILILHNFNKTRDGLLWLGWVVRMLGNCCKIDKQSISKIRISRRKSDTFLTEINWKQLNILGWICTKVWIDRLIYNYLKNTRRTSMFRAKSFDLCCLYC